MIKLNIIITVTLFVLFALLLPIIIGVMVMLVSSLNHVTFLSTVFSMVERIWHKSKKEEIFTCCSFITYTL